MRIFAIIDGWKFWFSLVTNTISEDADTWIRTMPCSRCLNCCECIRWRRVARVTSSFRFFLFLYWITYICLWLLSLSLCHSRCLICAAYKSEPCHRCLRSGTFTGCANLSATLGANRHRHCIRLQFQGLKIIWRAGSIPTLYASCWISDTFLHGIW